MATRLHSPRGLVPVAIVLLAFAVSGPAIAGPGDAAAPKPESTTQPATLDELFAVIKQRIEDIRAREANRGRLTLRICRAATQAEYWLYTPAGYNSERRYPLVVSLHGMKPYDLPLPHIRIWRDLADKYGYLVIVPQLRTSDAFGQFPLRKMGAAEKADVANVLACMDEVMTDWEVDRSAVCLSSWSMGGYLAHYIACEYGNRFAAFAPLQSNFSADVLDVKKAKQWAGKLPLLVFYGAADFQVVIDESKAAIEWYRKLDFEVTVKKQEIGHGRHPELAAEFFELVLAKRTRQVEIVVTPPGSEPAPLAVNLWPALSSKIGEVKTYVWDFGRLGGPSYQKSPNVLIRQPGEYPIKLTVIDKAGKRYAAETKLKVPAARN